MGSLCLDSWLAGVGTSGICVTITTAMIEKVLPVPGEDLVLRRCKCEELVRRERKRCKEMVMAVVDRLGLEEKMHEQTARKNDVVMAKIVKELVLLQGSLKTEQVRVEKLLHSKDLLIRKLQGKVGQLETENQRLTGDSKQGSDSGCENTVSDIASLEDESIPVTPPSPPDTHSSFTETSPDKPDSIPLALTPNVASIKGPKPPIASRESVNAKLHLNRPHIMDYVLITKNRSSASQASGLYVLDTEPASDEKVTDAGADISKVVTSDNTTVTPVHAMTNHRRVLKPSDIKYRAKRRAVSMSDKTRVTYWTDTFI